MDEGVFAGGEHSCSLGFSGAYSLWTRVGSSRNTSSIVALVGAMTLLPAMEAESFSDTSCLFCRG